MVWSVLLLMFALVMGVVAIWDVGGLTSRMRSRLEAGSFGAVYERLPSWTFRAWGVWCVLFGLGQLIFVFATTHSGSTH